jgi:hypothetical protein
LIFYPGAENGDEWLLLPSSVMTQIGQCPFHPKIVGWTGRYEIPLSGELSHYPLSSRFFC